MQRTKKILLKIEEGTYSDLQEEELFLHDGTVNMYVASIEELKLDYTRELTESIVYEAFKSCVKSYLAELKEGTEAPLTLSRLEGAKNYLIRSLKFRKG